MFERVTTSARVAVVTAQEEVRRLGHRRIYPPHLLLALLRAQPGGTSGQTEGTAAVLQAYGLTPEAVEAQVRARFDRPGTTSANDAEVLAALDIDTAALRADLEQRRRRSA